MLVALFVHDSCMALPVNVAERLLGAAGRMAMVASFDQAERVPALFRASTL
jgi:hypothetical protein